MADANSIAALYQQLIGRAPDAAGAAYYSGLTEEEVRRGILGSPEYAQRAAHQIAFPTMGQDQVGALASGGQEARQAYVEQQYRDILGRVSDPEGLAYWSDPTRFASSMSDGSLFDDFLGKGVMSDPNGSMPWDKTAARAQEGAEWDSYRDSAAAATAGINRMPGVFSDYGSVPADDRAASAMFFQTPDEAQKTAGVNPFLSAILSAAGASAGGKTAPAAAQSPTEGMHPDDIIAANRNRRVLGLPPL